ncbi:hypothetical protein ACWC5G_36115, partial [Streptomyces sp. NPDC001274]
MNIRSLTRGDGVVIGAAAVLFIASFLSLSGCSLSDCGYRSNAWDSLGLLMSVYLAGVIAAALTGLAAREVDVLRLVAEGYDTADIA